MQVKNFREVDEHLRAVGKEMARVCEKNMEDKELTMVDILSVRETI